MGKNKKRKKSKFKILHPLKIERSIMPDNTEYPESESKKCPKCMANYVDGKQVTIETKQGPIKMLECNICCTIYRLVID